MSRSRMPVISFDVDGVVVDTTNWVLNWVEKEFPGMDIGADALASWDYAQALGLTRGAYRRFWEEFYGAHMDVIPAAVATFSELRARGYDVHFVTARSVTQFEALVPVFRDFAVPPANIHHTQDKLTVLEALEARAHVDDKWQTAADLGEAWHGSGKISYLFDRPWNRGLDLMTLYYRINNFTEVLDAFQ